MAGALVGVADNLGNSIDYELDVMGNRVRESGIVDENRSTVYTLAIH